MDVISGITDKYLGLPYMHQGRDCDGLDCWGLIRMIYADRGIDLLDIDEPYDRNWSFKGKNFFIENYARQWDVVCEPQCLDVVLFKNGKGTVNHGGVYLEYGKFIHASKAGVVVSRVSDISWAQKLQGFYRLRPNGSN